MQALKEKKYKIVTITHGWFHRSHTREEIHADNTVDTSTGVLSPAERFSKLIREHSPESLIILDAVCSVASEEIQFDDWGLDMVISATQKASALRPVSASACSAAVAVKGKSMSTHYTWVRADTDDLTDGRDAEDSRAVVLHQLAQMAPDHESLRGRQAHVLCYP